MKKNKQLPLAEKKHANFRAWKKGKLWLYGCATLLALTGLVAVGTQPDLLSVLTQTSVVSADAITDNGGTTIGTVSGKPVVKTSNNDMTSQQFGNLVGALIGENANYNYLGTNISWQSNTTITGARQIGSISSDYGISYLMKQDGYNGATAVQMYVGDSVILKNMGYVTDKNGIQVNIDVRLTLNTFAGRNIAGTEVRPHNYPGYDGLLVALQGSPSDGTLKINAGIPYFGAGGGPGAGGETGSGGSANGGGGAGFFDSAGTQNLDSYNMGYTLLKAGTNEELTNVVQATRYSDIDQNQWVKVGNVGLSGWILASNTLVTPTTNAFLAPNFATNETDGHMLGALSIVKVGINTTNAFQYEYSSGVNLGTIASGIFGRTGINLEFNGKLTVDKTTAQYGKNEWNDKYGFLGLAFDVYKKGDAGGTVVKSFALDKDGKMKDLELPAGDYVMRERTTTGKDETWASTGQTKRPDVAFSIKAGATTTLSGATVENTAVLGHLTIEKSGTDYGKNMINQHYTLAGNVFRVVEKGGDGKIQVPSADGRSFTVVDHIDVTGDKDGKAVVKNLPLGEYTVTEIKSSDGFANTFKSQDVKISYKDENTLVVFGTVKGTNQEIYGGNKLEKDDVETGTSIVSGNGVKAEIKTAEYTYYYAEDWTGANPHKAGDVVKWSDMPNAKLVSGEKVAESIRNGQKVENGDNMVISIDDKNLSIAVEHMAIGKYYSMETNAPTGYAADSTKHYFEIKKLDDKTANVTTPNTKSAEKPIKVKFTLNKLLDAFKDGTVLSGINGVKFDLTPINGNTAKPTEIITKAINETTSTENHDNNDIDGYGYAELALGSWKLSEDVTTAPKGYDAVPDTYIHIKVDHEKDLITTIFSRSSDPDSTKDIIVTRTFSVDDNYGGKNPNAETINGIVTDLSPFVSIGKQVFVDKAEHPDPVKDVFGADSMNVSIDGTHFDKSINVKETGLDITWTWTVTQAVPNKNFDVLSFTDTLPSEVKYTGGAKVVQVTDDDNNPDTPFDPNKYDDAKNKDKSDDVTVDVTDNYDIKFDEKTNTLVATSKDVTKIRNTVQRLEIPTLVNIDNQPTATIQAENIATVAFDDDAEVTNEVTVKTKPTKPSIKKYETKDGGKTWTDDMELEHHDGLVGYRVDYILANNVDYDKITLTDKLEDIQVLDNNDLAASVRVIDNKGTDDTSDDVVLKNGVDYELSSELREGLNVDGVKEVARVVVELKDVAKYSRKTTNLSLYIDNVTIKGANGLEEFNYLNSDGRVEIKNTASLDFVDKTPTPDEVTKGHLDSNEVKWRVPEVDDTVEKYVLTDETGSSKDEQATLNDIVTKTYGKDYLKSFDGATFKEVKLLDTFKMIGVDKDLNPVFDGEKPSEFKVSDLPDDVKAALGESISIPETTKLFKLDSAGKLVELAKDDEAVADFKLVQSGLEKSIYYKAEVDEKTIYYVVRSTVLTDTFTRESTKETVTHFGDVVVGVKSVDLPKR